MSGAHNSAPATAAPIRPLHGLRGLAAPTVVLGHYKVIEGVAGLGVVLFFVLSGFLIGMLYLSRPFTGVEVRRYARARFGRDYPLFATVVLGAALINLALPGAGIFMMTPRDVLPHLLWRAAAWPRRG